MNLLNTNFRNNILSNVTPKVGCVYKSSKDNFKLKPGTIFVVLYINENNVVFLLSETMIIYFITTDQLESSEFTFYQSTDLESKNGSDLKIINSSYFKKLFLSLSCLSISN